MKPAYKISVNGSDITSLIADRLLSLTVNDEAGVNSDRVEIELDDRDERINIPPPKATMTVEMGYTTGMVSRGEFTIEEVELSGPVRTMTLRGTAIGASKGAGASRETSWHDTTLGNIATSIAKRHRWKPAIAQDLAAIKIEHADQNENDLQFLSRLAAENGAVVKVAAGRLVMARHGEGKRVSGNDMPTVTLQARDVSEWSMTIAERGDYTGVKAMYHDPVAGQRGESIAGSDDVNTHTLPQTYATQASASRAAQSKFKALKRGKSSLSITSMPGVPTLAAETRANMQGFRKGVDGIWTIIKVSHRISNSGYTCSLDCETPDGKMSEAS